MASQPEVMVVGPQLGWKTVGDLDVTRVPCRGRPEAIAGTIAGRACCCLAPSAAAVPRVTGGRAVELPASSLERSARLPQVPTMAESGPAVVRAGAPAGLRGPTGLRADLADRIDRDANRALATPELRERLLRLGAEPAQMTIAGCTDLARPEIEDLRRVTLPAGVGSR